MYADVKVATYRGGIRNLFRGNSGFRQAASSITHLTLYECGMSEDGNWCTLVASQSGTHPEIIFTAVGDDRAYVSREFKRLFKELGLEPRDPEEPQRRIMLATLYGES